jgi:threonine dehydrogenase-like Zn-dependent dehydrogenase
MDAVVWHGGADLRCEDVPEPVAAAGEVLVDVAVAGVCGSDLHAIRGHHGPRRPPLILGHELVGTVAGRPGRFAAFPLVACATAGACSASTVRARLPSASWCARTRSCRCPRASRIAWPS